MISLRVGVGIGLSGGGSVGGGGSPATITINSALYTVGSAGNAATIALDVTYTGAGSLTCYAVTGTNPVTVSASQLKAGSGGTNTLEFFNFAVSTPSDTDPITGLTATSEAADRIVLLVSDGTVDSALETVTVTGLDFTVPTVSSAATDTDGNTITVTMDSPVYGTGVPGDWTVNGVSAGTPTIDSVTVSGTTSVVIEISGNLVANGDTVTLDYTPGDIDDASGNVLASLTGQAVTNNVPGGSTIADIATAFSGFDYGDFADSTQTYTDRAQTTNVVSDGDLIRSNAGYQARIDWEDKDGGTTRPEWRTTEGAQGDGVNNRLRIQGDPNSGPGWFYGVRLKVQELNRLQTVTQIDDVQPIRQNGDNSFLIFGRRASDNGIVSTNVPESTHGVGVGDWTTVMAWQRKNGDMKIYVDGNDATASLGGTAKSFTAPITTMMVNNANSDHLNGRITRWAALPAMDTDDSDGDLSEAQITTIKAWLDAG